MSELELSIMSLEHFVDGLVADWDRRGLSSGEAERMANIRDEPTRLRWCAGRWLVKRMIAGHFEIDSTQWHRMHVESRDGMSRGSRPRLYVDGRLTGVQLSISHSDRSVGVAISTESSLDVGLDIAPMKPMSERIVNYWFSSAERLACRRHPLAATFAWSAKEALYKSQTVGSKRSFVPAAIDTTRWISADQTCERLCRLESGQSLSMRVSSRECFFWIRTPEELVTLVVHGRSADLSATTSVRLRDVSCANEQIDLLNETSVVLAT